MHIALSYVRVWKHVYVVTRLLNKTMHTHLGTNISHGGAALAVHKQKSNGMPCKENFCFSRLNPGRKKERKRFKPK